MKYFQYLVSSPVRVGSHYVLQLLGSSGVRCQKTHDPHLVVDYARTRLIMLDRLDRFSTLMSHAIWTRTHESNEYTNQDPSPFVVSRSEFDNMFVFNMTYHSKHDLSLPWAGVYRVNFEDVLADNEAFLQQFGLKVNPKVREIWNNRVPGGMKKSPYRYERLVINHEQCREWFEENLKNTRMLFNPPRHQSSHL